MYRRLLVCGGFRMSSLPGQPQTNSLRYIFSATAWRETRRGWSAFLFLSVSLCLCGVTRAQGLENYLGKPIAQVRLVIEGAPRQDAGEELRSWLPMREGGIYSAADVRRALQQLFNSGRVAEARVE